MINWNILWQPRELFLIRPPFMWELMWAYVGFLAACLTVLIVALLLKTLHPELKRRLITFASTQLWLGAFLFFFRYFRIPYLGMDFFRLIQEITAVIWIGLIVKFALTELPKLNIKAAADARKKKYLPGQK